MSGGDAVHQSKNEIIIVRRRGGGEDGHHGGAWKIAYADFMTAMMAFFLVMWLVNAANEETKASVASYFNPIKLMDDKPTERGIKEVGNSANGEATAPKSESKGTATETGGNADEGNKQVATAGKETAYSEADYFENPYAVLAEIAQETGTQTNVSAKGDGGAQTSGPATGATGGEAYRDPFDPDFWSKQIAEERAAADLAAADQAAAGAVTNPPGAVTNPPGAAGTQSDPVDQEMAPAEAEAQAEALRQEITQALGGALGKLSEGLTVTPAEGGLLVSITDQLDFGMFNVGSAIPEKDLVLAMEKIGGILAERQGSIAIRGHTDARPFSSPGNDNWRLSMARAHSAYFMLVRGGLSEARIVQVSGFADRRLKTPDDPLSEVNRRIEILIEAKGG